MAAAAGVVAFLCATPALANGRFPQSNQIVFSQKDPNLVIARTTYAILPSHDNGTSWWYLCEDVLGLPSIAVQDPELALTAGGSIVAGNYSPSTGLNVSSDVGCTWSCVNGALGGQAIADVVVRPDSQHTVLALTGTQVPSDGGPLMNSSQVFESTDDGATWKPLGTPIDPSWTVETIDVSKSDPQRIYVSAWRGFNMTRTTALFVSTNGAQTWTERDIPSDNGLYDNTTEDRIWIGAVDPTDADRVYLRSNSQLAGGTSRLYLTTDAGKTMTAPKVFSLMAAKPSYTSAEFLGFALSPDGSKVYVGSSQGGLYVADKATMTFTQTSPIDIHCLATRPSASGGTELWACGDAYTAAPGATGFLVGVSTDDGAHFTTKLSEVTALCGPLQCPNAGSSLGCNATLNGGGCSDSYMGFCQQNDTSNSCGTCPGVDGGTAPPGDAEGAAGLGAHKASSSCALAAGQGSAGALAAVAVAAAMLGGRRRRRK